MDTALATSESTRDYIHDLRFVRPVVVTPPAPHGVRRTLIAFAFCFVVLFASTLVLVAEFAEVDGGIFTIMVVMGAVIIAILLTGILLPFTKELREHRRR